MAKATANCVCATCGAYFTRSTICYNRRLANEWEEWATAHFDECSDCYKARIKAERKQKLEKDKAEMAEAGLPGLEGSEKQMAWAETIRAEWFKEWTENMKLIFNSVEKLKGTERYEKNKQAYMLYQRVYDYIVTCNSAKWWIDNRYELKKNYLSFAKCLHDDLSVAYNRAKESVENEVKEEATVIPAERKHDGVVNIIVTDKAVKAKYPKDDDFRELIKKLNYKWNGENKNWCKEISATTGTAQERAAELGNKLLTAGYAICIIDPETRKNAVEARYEPEHLRWVTVSDDGKKFNLRWYYGYIDSSFFNNSIYYYARVIRGAQWEIPYVTVPFSEYDSVLEYAKRYGFKFSKEAQTVLDKMQGKIATPAET